MNMESIPRASRPPVQSKQLFVPTAEGVRRMRRVVFCLVCVVIPVLSLLLPNWRAFKPFTATTKTNMSPARQRDMFARDLGPHWVFSPPAHPAGTEVWIDWNSSITVSAFCWLIFGLHRFESAWRQRRRLAIESNARREGLGVGANLGRAEMLIRLVTQKFGAPTDSLGNRIRNATREELERWSDRLLRANSIDEVFAGQEH